MAKAGTAATAEATIVDEYDLQPDEMTKAMVAAELGWSERKVEMLKADGSLKAYKRTIRVENVIKQGQLIFMVDDVAEFKANRDKPVEVEAADRSTPNTAMIAGGKPAGDVQTPTILMLAEFLRQNSQWGMKAPAFLSIDEAAAEFGLSPVEFHRLIDSGALIRYGGKHGRAMLSRRQIESL